MRLVCVLLSLGMTFFISEDVYSNSTPVVVQAYYKTAYVPEGYDNNDNVQIVVEGVFNNSCYRPGPVSIQVEHDKKIVYLKPTAFKYSGICLEVLVPYHQVLDLGILQAGKYSIIQSPQLNFSFTKKLAEITIRPARSTEPDDFLYAPVSQVYWESEKGYSVVQIEGEFSNSCMVLDKVLVSQQEKVIVVQPIAKMLNQAACLQEMVKFKRKISIRNLKKGKYLLHVRSLNARAVNALVEVE